MNSIDKSKLAIAVIVVTVFALALGDALIKSTSATFTLWQIFVLRSSIVVPFLILLIFRRSPGIKIIPQMPLWTIVRSLCLTMMWVTYYLSLVHIELSVAAASYYTLPLFITIFAAVFLDDSIGLGGWIAVIVGFIGVVMILEPRASDFNWYALLPLSSAVLYALAMILTRSRCRNEHIFVLSLWLNITMLALGAVATFVFLTVDVSAELARSQEFLFGPWTQVGVTEIAALLILAIAILIGSLGAAYAYQNGSPSTIATFDFAYVAFAMMWGIFVFDEKPSMQGLAGISLIVIAGILAIRSGQTNSKILKKPSP